MSYNPSQPRVPAGTTNGGEWTSDQLNTMEDAARMGAGLPPKKMKTFNSFSEIVAAGRNEQLYIRWSRGPELDKKQGRSIDQVSHQAHNGLSAQNLRADDPKLMAEMIPEYQFLRKKDSKIYPWIFAGTRNGTDSDGAPTIDAKSIRPVGRVSDALIDKMVAYSAAYKRKKTKYAYNAWKPEHHAMNAEIDAEVKRTWDELNK